MLSKRPRAHELLTAEGCFMLHVQQPGSGQDQGSRCTSEYISWHSVSWHQQKPGSLFSTSACCAFTQSHWLLPAHRAGAAEGINPKERHLQASWAPRPCTVFLAQYLDVMLSQHLSLSYPFPASRERHSEGLPYHWLTMRHLQRSQFPTRTGC